MPMRCRMLKCMKKMQSSKMHVGETRLNEIWICENAELKMYAGEIRTDVMQIK